MMPKKILISPSWNPRKHKPSLIDDGISLVAAFTKWGSEIRVYDDGIGPLWVYANELDSTSWIVRAQSFQDALECIYDEMEPIADDELHEAYGFDTREELDAAVTHAEENGEYLDLTDGYSYQANATGTGIVNHGYYEGLEELTHDHIDRLEISLVIEVEND